MYSASLLAFLALLPAAHAARGSQEQQVLEPFDTRVSHCKGQSSVSALLRSPGSASLRPMALIHIPRTGGTTIEDCTMLEPDKDNRWGRMNLELKGRHPFGCYGHHVPPNYFSTYYGGRETFCVVRHPLDRLISQYGFASSYFPSPQNNCTVEGLNSYLMKALQNERVRPAHSDCHFLPQAAYVWGWDAQAKSVNRAQRSCKRVLRYENLMDGFNQLMAESGYPYRLPSQHEKKAMDPNTRSPNRCHSLRRIDLREHVVRLAEEVYRDDFELLGYPRSSQQVTLSGVQIREDNASLRVRRTAELRTQAQPARQPEQPEQPGQPRQPGTIPVWVWWNYEHEPSWLVKACLASWHSFAPAPLFEIRHVNASNVRSWLPDLPKEFSRMPYDAATSDLVRAGLLAEHGGMYLDSDVLLTRSLSFITDHLQHADIVSYANTGQNCNEGSFSSNVMAGRRGNALHRAWYAEAKRQLSQRCKVPQSQDNNPIQPVCCYTPTGRERTCHISWGGIGERIGHPQMKMLLARGGIRPFCFEEKLGQGFAPSMPGVYASMVGGSSADRLDSCFVNGQDLRCQRNVYPNFFGRGAYHLFHAIWPPTLQTLGASTLLRGNYVISHLMRKDMPGGVLSNLATI